MDGVNLVKYLPRYLYVTTANSDTGRKGGISFATKTPCGGYLASPINFFILRG